MRSALALLPLALLLALLGGCGDASSEAGAACEDVEAPEPRDPGTRAAPTAGLDPATTFTMTFETNCGPFTVTLDQSLAPRTSASLVALAKEGYFDDTLFHRVVRRFVIQGGDPTQSGGGGPGYATVDVPPTGAKYTKGVVAMAKTPTDAPGTAGSQFFVVTGEDAQLPPEYAIVGEVTKGMDAVERIDALGAEDEAGEPVSGPPTEPVVVERVTVSER